MKSQGYDPNIMLINQIKEAAKKSVQEWQLFDPKKPKQNFFREVDLTRANLIEENSEEGIRRAQDENERDADKQLQRLWQNPYASRDAISKDELVSLSLSLMIISSQLLPNLGHRITGSDKDEFVRLIYEMPLRIFDEWASDIDNDKISIIRDIQQLYVLEYRKAGFRGESISDSKAIEYLRRESISLLLELMDICISNATRRNTYDLIDDFDHKKEIGFELEWLISHEKRSDVQTYIKEIDRINKENKSGLPHVMIQQVAAHYIMNNRSIDGRDIQHLNASIFDGKLPQRIMLLDRQANAKRT